MNHDFLLLPEKGGDYSDYTQYHHRQDSVKLHEDMLHYIADFLTWIPTVNPAYGKPRKPPHPRGFGLNFYGVTVINAEGATVAEHIFSCLSALFAEGPQLLKLTGLWTYRGENPSKGKYDIMKIDRNVLVRDLRTLTDYAQAAKDGSHYILHLGI